MWLMLRKFLSVGRSEIVKTLIVVAGNGVQCRGYPRDKRLMNKLSFITRAKSRVTKLGYHIGEGTPIALLSYARLLIDESILKHDGVYGGERRL